MSRFQTDASELLPIEEAAPLKMEWDSYLSTVVEKEVESKYLTKRLDRDGNNAPHKFGCLMLKLPDAITKQLTDWTIETVPDFHLGPGGRELSPHVTVAYGLAPDFDQLDELRGLLVRNGPIRITLSRLSAFTAGYGKWINEDGDVLKVDVDSPQLHALHDLVVGSFDLPGDKYPEFVPHCTLSYIDPSVIDSYSSLTPDFLPLTATCDEIVWSAADGSRETIRLGFLPTFGKHLTKDRGQPCEQGESAERSGCIPAKPDAAKPDVAPQVEQGQTPAAPPKKESPESHRSVLSRAVHAAGALIKDVAKAGYTVAKTTLNVARKAVKYTLGKIEDRYGKKVKAAVLAAIILAPPGLSPILAAPIVALAEVYRQFWFHEKADVTGEFEGIEKYDYPGEARERAERGKSLAQDVELGIVTKDQGQPCKRGETTRSGCIPAEGGSGQRSSTQQDPTVKDKRGRKIDQDDIDLALDDPEVAKELKQDLDPENAAKLDQLIAAAKQPEKSPAPSTPAPPAQKWEKASAVKLPQNEEEKKKLTDAWSKLLPDVPIHAAGNLVGAKGAEVSVRLTPDGDLFFHVNDLAYEAERALSKEDGKLVMWNRFIEMRGSVQGKGIGAGVFERQVESCRRAGISAIECDAAGPPLNGYYTWPRLGYDQPIALISEKHKKVKDEIKQKWPDAETVLDVMATPEGREWWKKNGVELSRAKFDLAEGSRSLRILDAYRQEKQR